MSVLGLALGTALYDFSLSHLCAGGYNIDGYYNGVIYLHNVLEQDYYWNHGILSYDDYGRFAAAQFYTSTSYRDLARFERLYDELCYRYGPPVARVGYESATWYGYDTRGYVTLEFFIDAGRYYTSLSYGC